MRCVIVAPDMLLGELESRLVLLFGGLGFAFRSAGGEGLSGADLQTVCALLFEGHLFDIVVLGEQALVTWFVPGIDIIVVLVV